MVHAWWAAVASSVPISKVVRHFPTRRKDEREMHGKWVHF